MYLRSKVQADRRRVAYLLQIRKFLHWKLHHSDPSNPRSVWVCIFITRLSKVNLIGISGRCALFWRALRKWRFSGVNLFLNGWIVSFNQISNGFDWLFGKNWRVTKDKIIKLFWENYGALKGLKWQLIHLSYQLALFRFIIRIFNEWQKIAELNHFVYINPFLPKRPFYSRLVFCLKNCRKKNNNNQ